MSEVTLTDVQLRRAAAILWNFGQFRTSSSYDDDPNTTRTYELGCDVDDVHEYLVEAGLLVQDHDADTDKNPDAFQWLSDDSMNKLRTVIVRPVFIWSQP